MADFFIGEIRPVGFTFAPQGWALCDGSLMSINQNTALFSLLGTTYGGNGTTTFALPDLRGRVALSSGQGPGLSNYALGDRSGVESVTLTVDQLAPHAHNVNASSAAATAVSPVGGVPAKAARTVYRNGGATGAMAPDSVGNTGSGQPHDNHQPSLSVLYIIALVGIFPPHP